MKIERFNEGRNRHFDIYMQSYNVDSEEDAQVLNRDLTDLDKHKIKYYMFSRNNSFDVILYFKRTTVEILNSLEGYYNNSSCANIDEVKEHLLSTDYKIIKKEDIENLKFIIQANKFNI